MIELLVFAVIWVGAGVPPVVGAFAIASSVVLVLAHELERWRAARG